MIDVVAYGERTFASLERRGMHSPMLSIEEAFVRAHAETSEVFEAWIARVFIRPDDQSTVQVCRNVAEHHATERYILAEWRGPDGKPEGVAAELADVVLTCCYLWVRRWHSVGVPLTWKSWMPQLPNSIVECIGSIHKSIAGTHVLAAISKCYAIAERLGIDLDAAIERKAAYNDVRPPTSKRL